MQTYLNDPDALDAAQPAPAAPQKADTSIQASSRASIVAYSVGQLLYSLHRYEHGQDLKRLTDEPDLKTALAFREAGDLAVGLQDATRVALAVYAVADLICEAESASDLWERPEAVQTHYRRLAQSAVNRFQHMVSGAWHDPAVVARFRQST